MPEQEGGYNPQDRKNSGTDHEAIASLVSTTAAFHAVVNEKFCVINDKFADIKVDLKDIKDNFASRISDIEVRLNKLETSRGNQTILISIGTGMMTLLVGLVTYHIIGE